MNLARTIGAGLLTAGMLALVIVLAVLQYQWLGEVSLAETQRLKFAVGQSGGAVASDLSVEIGAMVTLLQPAPGEMDSNDWSTLAEGYDIWTKGSLEPDLLEDVLLVTRPRDGTFRLQRWSQEQRRFEAPPKDAAGTYAPLLASLVDHTATPEVASCVLAIVPVFEAGNSSDQRPLLVLVLDKQVLIDKLIPRLVASRFGDSNMKDQFVVRIIDFAQDQAKPNIAYTVNLDAAGKTSAPVALDTSQNPRQIAGDFFVPLFNQRVLLSAFSSFFPDKVRLNPNFEKSMIRIWYGKNNVSKGLDDGAAEYFFSRSAAPGVLPDSSQNRSLTIIGTSKGEQGGRDDLRILHPDSGDTNGRGPQDQNAQDQKDSQPGRWQDRLRDTVIINMTSDNASVYLGQGQGPQFGMGGGGETGNLPAGPVGIHADWALSITHKDGSLSEAVERNRIRNLIVSLGILCLLTTAMIVLFLAGRRASSVAAREREFVASVSHELRTPLAVLRSAGENLTDGIVRAQDRVERYGRLVVQESRRLHGMVEDMLLYAGLQSGHRRVAFQAIDVKAILDEILQSRAGEIATGQTQLEFQIPETLPEVPADSTAFRSAMENLIDNALRHGSAGQWLGIRVHAGKNRLYIEVADRGPGVPRKEQSRIFQPFVRGSRAFNNQVPGSGLGLSLVRRIARQHGGRVRLYSKPGKGARFVFELPLAKAGT